MKFDVDALIVRPSRMNSFTVETKPFASNFRRSPHKRSRSCSMFRDLQVQAVRHVANLRLLAAAIKEAKRVNGVPVATAAICFCARSAS